MFWFSLQPLSETFTLLRWIQRDIIINVQYIGLHVQYRIFLSDFNTTWIFGTDFRKVFKYQIFWRSIKWEPSCSMRPDRQTERQADWTKLIATFRKCANAPKNTDITTGARTTYEASLRFSLIVMYVTRGLSPGNTARPQNMWRPQHKLYFPATVLRKIWGKYSTLIL